MSAFVRVIYVNRNWMTIRLRFPSSWALGWLQGILGGQFLSTLEQSEWFSGPESPGGRGTLSVASSVVRGWKLLPHRNSDQSSGTCHHGTLAEFHALQGSFTYSTSLDYLSNYVKRVGYTKVSYPHFYRVEANRISNWTDFPNSFNDWVMKWGEACSPLQRGIVANRKVYRQRNWARLGWNAQPLTRSLTSGK